MKGVAVEERARDRRRTWDLDFRAPLLPTEGRGSFGRTRLSFRNQKNMGETRYRPSVGTPCVNRTDQLSQVACGLSQTPAQDPVNH